MLNRLSLFTKNSTIETPKTNVESSYLATLTNSIGWFNPFNISRENACRIFYITYLLNKTCLTNGVACMLDMSTGQAYAFMCGNQNNQSLGMSPEENRCWQAIQDNGCNVDPLGGCAVLYQSPNKLTTNFGPGYFGGHRCELYSFYQPIDDCVVDVLTKMLPKTFGTQIDKIVTSCLSLGGVATLGGCGLGLYSLFKRYTQPKDPMEIEAREDTALYNQRTL